MPATLTLTIDASEYAVTYVPGCFVQAPAGAHGSWTADADSCARAGAAERGHAGPARGWREAEEVDVEAIEPGQSNTSAMLCLSRPLGR